MSFATRSDLIIPEILIDAVRAEIAGRKALYGSRAVVMNDSLPTTARGGDGVKVPFFNHIGEAEFLDEGQPLTVAKITMSDEEAVVIRAGKAFEITDWARRAAAGDAYEEAARQVVDVIQRAWDFKLIEVAKTTTLIRDIYDAGNPKKLTLDEMIKAKLLWGDEQQMIALGVLHSQTDADIRLQKDGQGRHMYTDAANDGEMSRYGGVPLALSDRLTPSSDTPPKYTSLICKEGSLVLWHNPTPTIETGRDILTGAEIVAVNTYFIVHRYGRKPGTTKTGVAKIIHNAGE
jgi:hypothetical protein